MKYIPKELGEAEDASRGKFKPRVFAKGLGSLVLVAIAAYLLLSAVVEVGVRFVPDSVEARLGRQISDQLEMKGAYPREKAIFQKLLQVAALRELPYEIYIVNESAPNAFALPGGIVMVTTGLLEGVKSEKGLAMVIGHEIGHHQERHVLKRMGKSFLAAFALWAVFGGEPPYILSGSFGLAELQYGQEQELEADQIGIELVQKAYGDTKGALEFFEYIQSRNTALSGKWERFFSTHPYTPDRIEKIRHR